MADLNAVAAHALEQALAGADAEDALAAALRAAKLENDDRARVAKWVLGSSVMRLTLRHWLRKPNAGAAELIDAYQRFIEANAPPDVLWPENRVERLSVEASVPMWLAELWDRELGFENARSLVLAMNQPGPTTLRANTLHTDRDSLAVKLREEGIVTRPGRLAPNALHVEGRANLWGSTAWRNGLFEVQDEGSQLIVEACRAKPRERWLDLCAGNGGKTLALAAAMGGTGTIVACDVDRQKLQNLDARLKRARVNGVEIRELEPGREAQSLHGERFDGVLVDAPCSELGTLRRHPDARWRLDLEKITKLPALQLRLSRLATDHLEPGGKLVYATCTIHKAENEDVVSRSAVGLTARTLRPDVDGTDGFFIARSE
ncbi:MAG: methyltransferase [Deltaproteobacteria bacterium]|nr:methyltransferase [Deltaproteobacteria bacterium]